MLWTEPLLICGFSDVGSALARLALRSGRHAHQVTVVEQDPDRARLASQCGYRVVTADPASAAVLRAAGAGVADRIVICLGDDHAARAVRAAASLARRGDIQVVLRERGQERLARDAGADLVLSLSSVTGKLLAAAAVRPSRVADVQASG